jgi:hypothetical protein
MLETGDDRTGEEDRDADEDQARTEPVQRVPSTEDGRQHQSGDG